MTLLAAKTFDLGHGNTLYTYLRQGFTNIVKLEGFYNGCNHFHCRIPLKIKSYNIAETVPLFVNAFKFNYLINNLGSGQINRYTGA
jgi:hypothetical protein